MSGPLFADLRLVNGSAGDPVLYASFPGRQSALLFDGGDNTPLSADCLGRVEALFLTHHHVDHFVGLDRLARANLDRDKTLRVFGPDGTLRRVQQRLSAYVVPHFDFTKLVVEVHDLMPGRRRVGRLACDADFAPGEVREEEWPGPVAFANDDVEVEACPTDHTVPGLAYALVEKPGHHPDPRKLASGLLRPGPWVGDALALLRAKAKSAEPVVIDDVPFPLGWLRDHFFGRSQGARVAFVVDTLLSDASRPGLLRLAARARRLYCDCYYAAAQKKQAATHKHLTAPEAAAFAAEAAAEDLVLIHFAPRYAGRYHLLVDEAREAFPRARAELHP